MSPEDPLNFSNSPQEEKSERRPSEEHPLGKLEESLIEILQAVRGLEQQVTFAFAQLERLKIKAVQEKGDAGSQQPEDVEYPAERYGRGLSNQEESIPTLDEDIEAVQKILADMEEKRRNEEIANIRKTLESNEVNPDVNNPLGTNS